LKVTSRWRLAVCLKGTVSHFYFIKFCQILAMKLNVCKEITSVDLNDKTIASLQPNVSPGRYNLKLQANKTNFENSSAQQYFKNPYCNPFQSSSLLAIRTFVCICCVIEMFLQCFNRLFLYFTEFDDHFPWLNLAKIRDTVPSKRAWPMFPKWCKRQGLWVELSGKSQECVGLLKAVIYVAYIVHGQIQWTLWITKSLLVTKCGRWI